jgi:cold shock CspA family protein
VKLRGIIKFYDSEKEFGFITPDTGGSDIFFNRKAIISNAPPATNNVVQFDVAWAESVPSISNRSMDRHKQTRRFVETRV